MIVDVHVHYIAPAVFESLRRGAGPGVRLLPADYFRLRLDTLRRVLRIGLPAAGENLSYWLALVVCTSFASRMGETSLAAWTYSRQITIWVILFAISIGLGTEIQLITPIGRMTPAGRMPGMLLGKVGGVFYSGMYEYDRKNVYVPLAVAQRFLLAGDRVSGIEVKLADVEDIDEGNRIVEQVVKDAGRGDELIVEDWRDLNRNLFSAMFLEKVAMFIALLQRTGPQGRGGRSVGCAA